MQQVLMDRPPRLFLDVFEAVSPQCRKQHRASHACRHRDAASWPPKRFSASGVHPEKLSLEWISLTREAHS